MSKMISSYYYGFEKTGVPEVDEILTAVARAGKCFHNTDQWQEEVDGSSPQHWIQEAADNAAKALKDQS